MDATDGALGGLDTCMSGLFDVDKSNLLAEVLHRHGIPVHYRSGWYSVSCPIKNRHSHGDKNKSASVSISTGYLNCHGCGFKGDGFDLMKELEGLDANETKRVLGLQGEPQQQGTIGNSGFTFAKRDA